MDPASLFRLAGDVPPEHHTYYAGDRVLVWCEEERDFLPGTVATFTEEGDGCFTVLLDVAASTTGSVVQHEDDLATGRTVVYLSDSSSRKNFNLALPAGHCGAQEQSRQWIRTLAVPAPEAAVGDRAGWRALLVGPGARSAGLLLADALGITTDADESSLEAGGCGEAYWLYLGAPSPAEARKQVEAAAAAQVKPLLELLYELEALQRLDLSLKDGRFYLQGCCAHALEDSLKAHFQNVEVVGEKQIFNVREELLVFDKGEYTCESARPLIKSALRRLSLPEALLGDEQPKKPTQWLVSEEGAGGKYAGPQRHVAFPGNPNTLAVRGPTKLCRCVLQYAMSHAAVPAVRHVAEPLVGTHSCQARACSAACNSRQGMWKVRADAPEHARELVGDWGCRNLRNLFLNKPCCVPPGRYTVAVDLEDAPPGVDWGDWRCVEREVVAIDDCCLPNPLEYLDGEAPNNSLVLYVSSMPGIAFRQAAVRGAAEASFSPQHLTLLSGSVQLQEKLLQSFRAGPIHEGMAAWNGEDARIGLTPLPVCPCDHPHLWHLACRPKLEPGEQLDIEDLEEWAERVTDGRLPCKMCGDCSEVFNGVLPGLLDVKPGEGFTATFWSDWRPAPAALATKPTMLALQDGAQLAISAGQSPLKTRSMDAAELQELEDLGWPTQQLRNLKLTDADAARLLGCIKTISAQGDIAWLPKHQRMNRDLQVKRHRVTFNKLLCAFADAAWCVTHSLRCLYLLHSHAGKVPFLGDYEKLESLVTWIQTPNLTEEAMIRKLDKQNTMQPDRVIPPEANPNRPGLDARTEKQLFQRNARSEKVEHQALLLAHAVRELISKIVALALQDRLLPGLEHSTADVSPLRQGELLAREAHAMRPSVTIAALGFPDLAKELQDVLCSGVASTDTYTGRCLPRRVLWQAS